VFVGTNFGSPAMDSCYECNHKAEWEGSIVSSKDMEMVHSFSGDSRWEEQNGIGSFLVDHKS
jgi:hypothetical protein